MGKRARQYWLMKSEPDTYSIDDLARERVGTWEGVRNFQARNHMRAMKVDDLALFYHSSTEPPGDSNTSLMREPAGSYSQIWP